MIKPSEQKPWLKFFSEEALNATLPHKTIYEYMTDFNREHPDDYAISFYGNRITYGQLLSTVEETAASFAALGVKKDTGVCCLSATIPELVFSLYGLNKLGAVMFSLDPRRGIDEIRGTIRESGAKVMIVLDLALSKIEPLIRECGIEKVIVISVDNYMPGWARLVKQLKEPSPKVSYSDTVISWKKFLTLGRGRTTELVPFDPEQVVAVTMTGGTTGKPKGVMLTNDGFNAIALSFEHCGVPHERGQRFLGIVPAFASYGLVASLHMPLSLGLELVIFPRVLDTKVPKIIRKYRPEHTLMVPTYYERLMNSREMRHNFDLSFLRTAGSGGDTMNTGLETKVNAFLKQHGSPYPISQGYGMSEVSSAASCCCAGNFKSMSIGYPLLTHVIGVFRPNTTEELGYGEVGELCITGPAVMKGYFNNPEETAHVLRRHEDDQVWVHSGDLGYMDEEGFLFIIGRIKRAIVRADGHKVFPVNIEDVLSAHDDVTNCAVVGVRDRNHTQGQFPVAFVTLKEGTDPTKCRDELLKLATDKIEARSFPQDIVVINELPLVGMGKIDYARLTREYEDEHFDKLCV